MATVPVTRTFVAGEVVLASYFNTNIRDVLNYLLAPPIVQVRQTSSQSPADGTFTALTFTTEDVDSAGMHSNSSNTSRLTWVYPGYMRVGGGYGCSPHATGSRGIDLYKNGTVIAASESFQPSCGGSLNTCVPSRSILIFGNVNDYAELDGWQNSGGALATVVTTAAQSGFNAVWESN